MKSTLKPLDVIRFQLIEDSSRIPNFIDAKLPEHKDAFYIMESMLSNIQRLITPQILTDYIIELIRWENDSDLNQITSEKLYFIIYQHLANKVEEYIDLATELECFETCANLKKYQTL